MKPATLEFLKQRFCDYYSKGFISPPSGLSQREWGFVFFDASQEIRMRRHMAFADKRELADYLKNLIPAHVYYSTAYYDIPAAPTMQDKVWTGADLIFDLDADHIMRGPYAEMLERVRAETIKLVGMLSEELGFSRREMRVVFSGGRGYHIHISDLAVRQWGSPERREIIDYVCGIGLDPAVMLSVREGTPAGWRRRYIDALFEHLQWLGGLAPDDSLAYLNGLEGVRKKQALEFYENLGRLTGDRQTSSKTADLLQYRGIIQAMAAMEGSQFEARIRERGARADEPVTTDTRRLIRMPSSLHGGSGFRVTPLVDDPAEFDPLVDAVVFGREEVKVDMKAGLSMPLSGNRYTLQKGINTVPEALAVFVCCRGVAEIAGEG
jgi:DNA primase small subunit